MDLVFFSKILIVGTPPSWQKKIWGRGKKRLKTRFWRDLQSAVSLHWVFKRLFLADSAEAAMRCKKQGDGVQLLNVMLRQQSVESVNEAGG